MMLILCLAPIFAHTSQLWPILLRTEQNLAFHEEKLPNFSEIHQRFRAMPESC